MATRFDDNPTWPYRAHQIWLILIGKAYNRQTMTYGDLAYMLGFEGAGVFATPLDHILCYCELNGLPPLTCLVVNQTTGLPGDGLQLDDLHADRERVYNYDWYGLIPPSPEELAEARHEMRG
jgi:putative restriction endonuclease